MGDLVRMPFSEVIATLEVLERLGVTDRELAELRSDKSWVRQVTELLRTKTVTKFQDGILWRVTVLGGQFAGARMTTVLAGETLGVQREYDIVRFKNVNFTDGEADFRGPDSGKKAIPQPTIGSKVIYLPDVVEGSLSCIWQKEREYEDKRLIQDVLDRMPKVEGVDWIVGNASTICRVLTNHLKETGQHLLYTRYTWTTDTAVYQHPYKLRLIVGGYGKSGVHIQARVPWDSMGYVGLFVLGVPSRS